MNWSLGAFEYSHVRGPAADSDAVPLEVKRAGCALDKYVNTATPQPLAQICFAFYMRQDCGIREYRPQCGVAAKPREARYAELEPWIWEVNRGMRVHACGTAL